MKSTHLQEMYKEAPELRNSSHLRHHNKLENQGFLNQKILPELPTSETVGELD